jgi:hypothetical protein
MDFTFYFIQIRRKVLQTRFSTHKGTVADFSSRIFCHDAVCKLILQAPAFLPGLRLTPSFFCHRSQWWWGGGGGAKILSQND